MVRFPRSKYDHNPFPPNSIKSPNNDTQQQQDDDDDEAIEENNDFFSEDIFTISFVVYKFVPYSILLVCAMFVGWLGQNCPMWEGKFFATVIPLVNGVIPPLLIGHGKMNTSTSTIPVPHDMYPLSRPGGELFLPLNDGRGSGTNTTSTSTQHDVMMPMNGIGMCCRPAAYDDVLVERAVLWYLLLGGRHIDTAALYMNHKPIGSAIQEAMKRGIPRSEIWITTKLWPSHYGYKTVLDEVHRHWLKDLQVEYIDLVLMHAPTRFPRIPYLMNPLSDECGYAHLNRTMCHYRTWTALSRLRTEGTIRNVGVSNFGYSKDDDDDENENDDKGPQDGSLAAIVALHEKVDSVKYAPVTVNQMVYNPWISDEWMKTIQYCRDHQIQIVGYNTLGGNFQHRQASTIDVLLKLATKYSKGSVAQIMIKWAIQKGVAVIPGTSNPHHMRENLAVYDAFQLTDEEIEEIDSLRTSESAKQFFSIEPSVWA